MTPQRHLLIILWLLLCPMLRAEDAAQRTMRDFRQMGIPLYEAGDVTILPTATEKFRDLFHAVDEAGQYILLDYFKFQQDSICSVLLGKLYAKARAGVQVYIIFDSFGNHNSDLPLSDTLQARIRHAGIHIKGFDPVRFPWVNHLMHRDHHKIAVIDGRVCYTGGMNVADYYLHGKPRVGRWRDMHVRLTGPVVQAYEELFWKMWGTESDDSSLFTLHPSLLPLKGDGGALAFASRWPRESPAVMRQTYCCAIDNAQQLIQIVNPYAGLFGEVRAALRRALERGVRVQFMVSTKSDGRVNDDVVGLEMRKLMKRGAEVYYYNDGFHHSKVMMVDSLFCTIGTTNLDARSLCFDYEVNAFIFSPETTHALQQIFQDDVRHSTLLTPEVSKERFPPRRRIRSHIFAIAKRFL